MTPSEFNEVETKRPRAVYYSKFTRRDYLRTRLDQTTFQPPQPTRRDFLAAATNLRPVAKPFFPQQKLNPSAPVFQPREASDRDRRETFLTVRSLEDDVEARIKVDPLTPVVRLADLQNLFPLAKGLAFISADQERLISVISSRNFKPHGKGKIQIEDVKFHPPLSLDRTYYVTERSEMVDQILETRVGEQRETDTLDESGYGDSSHHDHQETGHPDLGCQVDEL